MKANAVKGLVLNLSECMRNSQAHICLPKDSKKRLTSHCMSCVWVTFWKASGLVSKHWVCAQITFSLALSVRPSLACQKSSHQIKPSLWAPAIFIYSKHLDLFFCEGKNFSAYFTFLMRRGEGVIEVVYKRRGSFFMLFKGLGNSFWKSFGKKSICL